MQRATQPAVLARDLQLDKAGSGRWRCWSHNLSYGGGILCRRPLSGAEIPSPPPGHNAKWTTKHGTLLDEHKLISSPSPPSLTHMEQSPLTHQPRPEVFQPKIVKLYEALFKVWS